MNKGKGEKNKFVEMQKKNKELLMNSKHLEKQEPVLMLEGDTEPGLQERRRRNGRK